MVALGTMRAAPAVFIGIQQGFGDIPDFALYNLTADIPGHPKGSTVSGQTLSERGFFLPPSIGESPIEVIGQSPIAALPTVQNCPRSVVFLEVVPHPAGGYAHAEPIDATRSTQRIYRGRWSTRRAAVTALETKFS